MIWPITTTFGSYDWISTEASLSTLNLVSTVTRVCPSIASLRTGWNFREKIHWRNQIISLTAPTSLGVWNWWKIRGQNLLISHCHTNGQKTLIVSKYFILEKSIPRFWIFFWFWMKIYLEISVSCRMGIPFLTGSNKHRRVFILNRPDFLGACVGILPD